MNPTDISPADILGLGGASVIVTIIVEVILRAWNPDDASKNRFGPLVALVIGVVVVVLFAVLQAAPIANAILTGLLAGASAMGIQNVVTQTILPPSNP